MDELKKYIGKDIIVYYDPKKCIHSGVCSKSLNNVFDISKKPWVNCDNDFSLKIAKVIDKCPSKALSFELINKTPNVSYSLNLDLNQSECIDNGNVIGYCMFEINDNILDITHTVVDKNYNGLGIAKKLVLMVNDYAVSNNFKVNPICSYAKKVLISD